MTVPILRTWEYVWLSSGNESSGAAQPHFKGLTNVGYVEEGDLMIVDFAFNVPSGNTPAIVLRHWNGSGYDDVTGDWHSSTPTIDPSSGFYAITYWRIADVDMVSDTGVFYTVSGLNSGTDRGRVYGSTWQNAAGVARISHMASDGLTHTVPATASPDAPHTLYATVMGSSATDPPNPEYTVVGADEESPFAATSNFGGSTYLSSRWWTEEHPGAEAGGGSVATSSVATDGVMTVMTVTLSETVTVEFDASNSTGNLPIDYRWDFGDGATGSGPTPSHEYSRSGLFHVTLVVTDSLGRTASATQLIDVVPLP